MKDKLVLKELTGCEMVRSRFVDSGLNLIGEFTQVHLYDQYGNLKYEDSFHNDITNAGKNALLDSFFRNQTQPAAWYFGLVDNSGFSAFAAGDTMSSHSGWTEFTTYSDSTRVAWTTVADVKARVKSGQSGRITFSICSGGSPSCNVSTYGTLGCIILNSAAGTPEECAIIAQIASYRY